MTYALRATPTRPPRSMAVECHPRPDLGRCWLILYDPDRGGHFVERDGERISPGATWPLDVARLQVAADVRRFTGDAP